MKKSFLKNLFLLFPFVGSSMFAQSASDSVPNDSLIISEIMLAHHSNYSQWGYVELCNTSTRTIDLSDFWLQGAVQSQTFNPYAKDNKSKISLKGLLGPGETFVFVGRSQDFRKNPLGEFLNPEGYANEYVAALAGMQGQRQLSNNDVPGSSIVVGGWRVGLFSRARNPITGIRDSIRIDQFWFNGDFSTLSEDNHPFPLEHPIAGIVTLNPQFDFIWVRKASIKYGSLNFDRGRGNDIADSEWMPLPLYGFDQFAIPYTTIKSHGNLGGFQLQAKNPGITIDMANKRINMPYGIRRDSVIREFNLGPNIAYDLQYGADTTNHYMMIDDTLLFYHCGDNYNVYKFGVSVPASTPADFASVSPVYYKVVNPPADNFIEHINRYTVSQGRALDTIGNVPFATRIDTLLKYLDVHGKSVDFTFVDNVTRADLNDGDKLTVTAADGVTKKTYRISVEPYYPSINADLLQVIFPGLEIFENPVTFYYSDTLFSFNRNVTSYVLNLPAGTTVSPAIQVKPANVNANIYVKRAKNLEGSDEEKTATIVVTAEDGKTVKTYTFLFNVERETPPLISEPFISDYSNGGGWSSCAQMQFFNPSDERIDLGDYMLFSMRGESWSIFTNSWANDSNFVNNNRRVIRPGYIVMPNSTQKPCFVTDNLYQKTRYLEPKGEYWVATDNGYPFVQSTSLFNSDNSINPEGLKLRDDVDLMTGRQWGGPGARDYWNYKGMGTYPYLSLNKTGSKDMPLNNFRWRGNLGEVFGIMKILNDSVKDGTKPMNANFETDYEIIDIVGGRTTVGVPIKFYMRGVYVWDGADEKVYNANDIHYYPDKDSIYTFRSTVSDAYSMYRKPHIYKGNPIDNASFGLGTEDSVIVPCEWVMYGFSANKDQTQKDFWRQGWSYNWIPSRFKNHVMVTYRNVPFITSKVYLISKGLTTEEKIFGVMSNTTVSDFIANVIKPDPELKIEIKSGSNVKEPTDFIATGDMVITTSADELSSVTYTIQPLGVLDNSVTLTSEVYTVNVEGSKVSNIPFGTTVKDLLSKISGPENALIAVVTGPGKDVIVPLEAYSKDTLENGANYRTDSKANGDIFIEVSAQDGVTVKYYSLEFVSTDKPMLISDEFVVDQDLKVVNHVYVMNVAQFLSRVKVTPGADVVVKSKDGTTRTDGEIRYDDKVVVSINGVSVTYIMRFDADKNYSGIRQTGRLFRTNVYPNPTNDFVQIGGLENARAIKIYNLGGKLLKEMVVNSDEITINMQHYENGIYLVNIIGKNDIVETRKVVKF
jgi:hypothetical protein